MIRNLFVRREGTAAVEAAIFLPIFMLLSFGIVDLGSAMFVRQQANMAAQAGAMYAVGHVSSTCNTTPISSTCLSAIQTVMNDASGHPTFCTPTGAVPIPCPASIDVCAGTTATPPTKCVTVTSNYSLVPILPSSTYAWAQAMTISYTVTIRVS